MRKNIFAVCDLEKDYARNFMEHVNQKKNLPFEVQAFTNVENLIAFGRENHIELLLISAEAMCREIEELKPGKIIVLSENSCFSRQETYPSVYKYQSSSELVREVMACYGEERAVLPEQLPFLKKKTEILGVYAPVNRCLKTSFALTIGQLLAKNRSVLYLNLEEYAGFEELFGKSFSHNLSDLLYHVRQGTGNFSVKMSSMTETVNKLDFIPPVLAPCDIRNTAWQDWERLLQEIVLHSNYEVIVLDIGNGIDEVFHMLDLCGKIYMPVLADVVSRAKYAQFENLLRIWDFSQVLTRIVKIQLPPYFEISGTESYVEKLMWSELGEYAKKILREDGV